MFLFAFDFSVLVSFPRALSCVCLLRLRRQRHVASTALNERPARSTFSRKNTFGQHIILLRGADGGGPFLGSVLWRSSRSHCVLSLSASGGPGVHVRAGDAPSVL